MKMPEGTNFIVKYGNYVKFTLVSSFFFSKMVSSKKKGKSQKLPRSSKNSAILRLPSKSVQEIVNGDMKLKYPNWALPRLDKITGIKYRLKNQRSYNNVLGSRSIGMYIMMKVKKGELVSCSSVPGVKISKLSRSFFLKKGYWFMGSLMYSKYENCMRANVRVANGPTSIEAVNVKLKVMSHTVLIKKGYTNVQKGQYCVLVAETDISAGSALVLRNYGNKKRFPFGYDDYLSIEKRAICAYDKAKSKAIRGYEKTCHRCCCNYPSRQKKTHNFQCLSSNTLFQQLLQENGFFFE